MGISENAEIIEIKAAQQTCILYQNLSEAFNRLKCWGRNDSGQQGRGNTDKNGNTADSMGTNLEDITMPEGINLESIDLNNGYMCAIDSNKKARCWGRNNSRGILREMIHPDPT